MLGRVWNEFFPSDASIIETQGEKIESLKKQLAEKEATFFQKVTALEANSPRRRKWLEERDVEMRDEAFKELSEWIEDTFSPIIAPIRTEASDAQIVAGRILRRIRKISKSRQSTK